MNLRVTCPPSHTLIQERRRMLRILHSLCSTPELFHGYGDLTEDETAEIHMVPRVSGRFHLCSHGYTTSLVFSIPLG